MGQLTMDPDGPNGAARTGDQSSAREVRDGGELDLADIQPARDGCCVHWVRCTSHRGL
jgi:hypothetical protein